MPGETSPRVAVVGAGLCGLMAASTLQRAGLTAVVWEKSRGLGGRTSTRRTDLAAGFDHGAPGLTLHDPRLEPWWREWVESGLLQPWSWSEQGQEIAGYVAQPGMSALAGSLGASLAIQRQALVVALRPGPRGAWRLALQDGTETEGWDAVLLTAPAEQTQALLQVHPPLAAQAAPARSEPRWVAMVGGWSRWPDDRVVWQPRDPSLSRAVRESAKPGRGGPERLVVTASLEWTVANLEAEPEAVAARLWAALASELPRDWPAPTVLQAHRWRFAEVGQALGVDHLWCPEARLGAGGDWCPGGRAEGALRSGLTLAQRLIRELGP